MQYHRNEGFLVQNNLLGDTFTFDVFRPAVVATLEVAKTPVSSNSILDVSGDTGSIVPGMIFSIKDKLCSTVKFVDKNFILFEDKKLATSVKSGDVINVYNAPVPDFDSLEKIRKQDVFLNTGDWIVHDKSRAGDRKQKLSASIVPDDSTEKWEFLWMLSADSVSEKFTEVTSREFEFIPNTGCYPVHCIATSPDFKRVDSLRYAWFYDENYRPLSDSSFIEIRKNNDFYSYDAYTVRMSKFAGHNIIPGMPAYIKPGSFMPEKLLDYMFCGYVERVEKVIDVFSREEHIEVLIASAKSKVYSSAMNRIGKQAAQNMSGNMLYSSEYYNFFDNSTVEV